MPIEFYLDSPEGYLKQFTIKLDADLIFLTGLNGSGKSQIIDGIASGKIRCTLDNKIIPPSRILKFETQAFMAYQPYSIHQSHHHEYKDYTPINNPAFQDMILNYRFNKENVDEILLSTVGLRSEEFSDDITTALERGDLSQFYQLISNIKVKKYNNSISKALKNYYEAKANAEITAMVRDRGHSANPPESIFNVEELINSILYLLKLDYRVYGGQDYTNYIFNNKMRSLGASIPITPDEQRYSPESFNIRFINTNNNNIVGAEFLSSGEKTLLNIGSIIANDTQYSPSDIQPLILMFDEPDAHLHPEYSQVLLQLLNNEFINKHKFKILISTHSPITISLSNSKEAILVKNGMPEVVSKSVALSNLMSGIVHIDVLSRDNAYVFVESHNDVNIYSHLYNIVSKDTAYLYKPIFIPSSHGEGGNCHLVQHLLNNLPDEKIFHGIIDWDTENVSNGRLHVLAEGSRYSIENILFDPLIMVAFCIINGISPTFIDTAISDVSLSEFISSDELKHKYTSQWTKGILGSPALGNTEYKYRDGTVLDIDSRYMLQQGHDLEGKIRKSVPQIGGYNQRLHASILRLLRDYPGLIPVEVMQLFRDVLS
ncbi:AAA family ATPase [Deinococcus aquaticus]|uniref:AAA family ATPase n=1 Tax=Deinococcus aquaticus TaxID=328692 RepID=A0ABY7V0Z7_9DEIO|nr:AAA family ATPase [Deinococcus aquaticus]WDA58857.1 AAA family ATPase [Deinococcus aquaticus]